MNFQKFQSVDTTNERKPRTAGAGTRVQKYDGFKYTRGMRCDKDKKELGIEGKFFVSNKQWEALNLNTYGLRQFTDKESGETVIAVVADENATMFKKSKKSPDNKKSKSAKWTRLEAALNRLGVIDMNTLNVNQFLNVSYVDGNGKPSTSAVTVVIDGITCVAVISLSKGETKAKEPAVPKTKKEKVVASGEVNQDQSKQPNVVENKVETPAPTVNAPVESVAKNDWED